MEAKSLGNRAEPSRIVSACTETPPDSYSLDKPKAQIQAEDEEDTESDDDDDALPSGRKGKGIAPGLYNAPFGCLLIDGSVDTGTQTSIISTDKSRFSGASRLTDTQSLLLGTVNFTHQTSTEFGSLTTRFGVQADPDGNATLPHASIQFGNAVVGVQPSFFNAWLALEFSFRALAATQSPLVAAYIFRPTDSSTLSISLEDPSYRRVTISGYGPTSYPDVVGRYRYYSGNWQFILSGAIHQTTFANSILKNPASNNSPIWGAAIQAYARYALPNEAQSDNSFVVLQFAYAKQAAGYLGINTPTSGFRLQLPGAFGADNAERSIGWNGAGVVSWAWSEKWRSAAFTSFTKLNLPDLVGNGSVLSTRSAINLTYTPVASLEFTLEAGFARVISANSGIPSARQWSVILSASRSFP
ncbi:Porin subfamily protein [Beijerinckia sp. 28-YEA-48]|nr:Porin subfamily protein [Beijerinckia sp. 28-YEA-48]